MWYLIFSNFSFHYHGTFIWQCNNYVCCILSFVYSNLWRITLFCREVRKNSSFIFQSLPISTSYWTNTNLWVEQVIIIIFFFSLLPSHLNFLLPGGLNYHFSISLHPQKEIKNSMVNSIFFSLTKNIYFLFCYTNFRWTV